MFQNRFQFMCSLIAYSLDEYGLLNVLKVEIDVKISVITSVLTLVYVAYTWQGQ